MPGRQADEVADTIETGITERGVAESTVSCRIGSIQADGYAVNQTGQFRQDIAPMHLIGLAVGVDTDAVAAPS